MRLVKLTCAVVGAVLGWGAPALAEMSCGPRADVVAQLGDKYQESTVDVGQASSGDAIVEVLTSPDGATWTIIVSMPNGTSCLLAAGENWQPVGSSPPSSATSAPPAAKQLFDPSKGSDI